MRAQDIHSLPYMPQLDGLRAILVLAVVFTHYYPEPYWPLGIFWAPLAVRCFFVLSGFLITTILLRDIAQAQSFLPAYGRFIARRALRLYPILLVSLLATAALGVAGTRETLPWHLFYLTNFYMAPLSLAEWPGGFGHLWSLATEEQFYLVWPLLIFLIPRSGLPKLLLAMILLAPVLRIAWTAFGFGETGGYVLAPASMDALALGALIATARPTARTLLLIGLTGLAIWAACTVFKLPYRADDMISLIIAHAGGTGAALFFMWLVTRTADGFSGIVGYALNNAVLRYVGSISYGIYILHNMVPYASGFSPHMNFAATVVLAALSWHLIERPIMRMGRQLSPRLRAA
jgi:peptidoglycan/LPS O-acetylase OafA/YrhL